MEVILANPRGFCAGVDRAIEIVERALELFGAPIYVRHEVVHNRYVVNNLRDKGVVFVDELEEVPDDGTVIFSAHGVSQMVRSEAQQRRLRVFDATCPLVTKVHLEVSRFSEQGSECVLIGHAGHPEVEGTMGQYNGKSGGRIYLVEDVADVEKLTVRRPESLKYVTQTTLSVDDAAKVITALRQRFPAITGPRKDDICYATQNRQDAVRELACMVDMVMVVGSPNSSNSNRLRELAEQQGVTGYLVDSPEQIEDRWLEGKSRIGLTAGASAPEVLVQKVIDCLKQRGATSVTEQAGREENITFVLPGELRVSGSPME
jgi:4-hydroxy-3-methylbut-2-enyl diphosphate reductase